MDYERLRRRSSFREGARIRLADGQLWALAAPPNPADEGALGTEYPNVIRAVAEADDDHDARLAELCLVILLLNHNYDLSAADFDDVLDFDPESDELTTARAEFRGVAREHLKSFLDGHGVRGAREVIRPAPRRRWRFGTRLRAMLSLN